MQRLAVACAIALVSTGCASVPANDPQRKTSRALEDAPGTTSLGKLAEARRTQSGARADSGFALLSSVDAAFTGRLALAESAQRSLDLQYYAIHADASTEVLLRGVRDAARRGVRVRILLDDFNTVGADAQVLRLAFEPNIEMRLFNPVGGSRSSLAVRLFGSIGDIGKIQKRMHNKLFLADNAWGIAGGRNLGDQYFGAGDDSNFVDLDVLAAGRLVRDMSASFDRYWNDELAYPVQTLLSKKDLDDLRKPADAAPAPGSPPPATPASAAPSSSASAARAGAKPPDRVLAALPIGAASASVLPDVTKTAADLPAQGRRSLDLAAVPLVWAPSILMVDKPGKVAPGDDEVAAEDTVVDGLLGLMRQARQDVTIISPYFVPGADMMAVFGELRGRGVRVRVLTNSLASNDAPAAHAGYARYRGALLERGVELYEMRAESPVPGSGAGSSGSGRSGGSGMGSGINFGSGPGGSKSAVSKASLHSKAVFIDQRIAVIGSMNLDLRSKIQNSEVALIVRSATLAKQGVAIIENMLNRAAYRVERGNGGYVWRAPAGANFADATQEPGAGLRLRLFVNILGPLAPESML